MSLNLFLKRQNFIFILLLFLTFVCTSFITSLFASKRELNRACVKLETRLKDLNDILTREAVIGSIETLKFEIKKFLYEYELASITYTSDQNLKKSTGCNVNFLGYDLVFPLMFDGLKLGIVEAKKENLVFSKTEFITLYIPIVISFLLSFFLSFWFRKRIERAVASPIINLAMDLNSTLGLSDVTIKSSVQEYVTLQNTLNSMFGRLRESADRIRSLEVLDGLAKLSTQVAHDIRSPLAALTMLEQDLNTIPEEKRIIVRRATQRINDIANELLRKGKPVATVSDINVVENSRTDGNIQLLSSLVDNLISEKRMEFRSKIKVSIETDFSKSYGLFTSINPLAFQRTLSNLINNSVDAMPNSEGSILVKLFESNNRVVIAIRDNGIGMPLSVLNRLGEKGLTWGKENTKSGSGIGVHCAVQTIKNFGGEILFESKAHNEHVNHGTTVTIFLPKAVAPTWFVERLVVRPNEKLVVLDDDQSIHGIWNDRLTSLGFFKYGIALVNFSDTKSFEKWFITENYENVAGFLVDYEFLQQTENGLDVIERMKIYRRSYLVTSRYDDHAIRIRAEKLGVKIIPKGMAPFVPFELSKASERGQSQSLTWI